MTKGRLKNSRAFSDGLLQAAATAKPHDPPFAPAWLPKECGGGQQAV
ncbi:Uncharacterised protein [Kingella potus]|uniref:Uncharacterized protein n=1 Tax=Kingella potus TaxID=265175 RepID=A0A377R1S3_9NEIS|nr:hypothetical protein [Kingella potus]UOP01245.1 hypothetical protein LVJ84_02950 [Kingella potus]STR00975.1 Uncharacterised protein [Kingella potus]